MRKGQRQGSVRRREGGLLLGIALLLTLSLSPARVASAQDAAESAPDYVRDGFYGGVGGVYAIEQFDRPVIGDNSLGWGVWAGYRFHPRAALETQIESISGFDFADPTEPVTFTAQKLDPVVWTVNGRYFLLKEKAQPYALLGAGLLLPGLEDPYANSPGPGAEEAETIDTAFTLKFGGGVDYYLTEKLSVNVNAVYTMPIGSGLPSEISYVSVGWGFQYHFHFAAGDD